MIAVPRKAPAKRKLNTRPPMGRCASSTRKHNTSKQPTASKSPTIYIFHKKLPHSDVCVIIRHLAQARQGPAFFQVLSGRPPNPQLALVGEGFPIRMLEREVSQCPQAAWGRRPSSAACVEAFPPIDRGL